MPAPSTRSTRSHNARSPSLRTRGAAALACALLAAAGYGFVGAATAATGPDAAQVPEASSTPGGIDADRKARSLLGLLASRRSLMDELAALQAALDTEAARGREDAIRAEIQAVVDKLADLDRSFSELSAGLDPGSFGNEETGTGFDLASELRELLGPLVNELKRATSRPREIDRLRTEIDQTRERLERIDVGLRNLAMLSSGVGEPTLNEALARENGRWLLLRQELATLYEIDRQKLDQLLAEQTSLGEALENVFALFFKSRGRNLILALAATGLFMVLLRRLHARALQTGPMQSQGDALLPRLLNLVFVFAMGIGGVLVFLLVLYLFGDWVLLILMLLLVFGALWASKQAIPRFWNQATLLLNLGPVREGERLVIDGLPYVVERLNFYSELVNERLAGGLLRLPISDLAELRSRPFDEAELFFPSAAGDWVVLADDTYGQVEVQSPEHVLLRLKGGAAMTLSTADYLSKTPVNLSGGYVARQVFSLDYAHLAEITEAIPETLRSFIAERIVTYPMGEHVGLVEVFFAAAEASSLDVRISVEMAGEAADFYRIVPRILSRLCVDACNEYGWSIPFPQLTVHAGEPVVRSVAPGELEPATRAD